LAYSIRFRRRAREEVDALKQTYSRQFASDLDQWFTFIATAAEARNESHSIDAYALLQEIEAEGFEESRWKFHLKKFASADMMSQIRQLLVMLGKRCPPTEFRMTTAWFDLLESVKHDVQAFYEIDHAGCRVILCKVDLGDGVPYEDEHE